jgi:hypothetical protein
VHPDLKHWKTQDTQHILSCSDLKLARNLGRALCDGGRKLATFGRDLEFDSQVADWLQFCGGRHVFNRRHTQWHVFVCSANGVRCIPNIWRLCYAGSTLSAFTMTVTPSWAGQCLGPMPMSGMVFIPTSYIHLDIPQTKARHTIESETDSGFSQVRSPWSSRSSKINAGCAVQIRQLWSGKETRLTKSASSKRLRQS